MPIDASIPLQVKPPQLTNPLADVMQIQQMKQAQALLPLRIQEAQTAANKGALELEEYQKKIKEEDDSRASYAAATSIDPTTGLPTTDRTRLSREMLSRGLGLPHVAAANEALDKIVKSSSELTRLKAETAEIQGKVSKQHADYAAGLAGAFKANDFSPAFARQQIPISVANGDVSQENGQKIIGQLDQLNAQDKTGDAEKAFLKQWADTAQAQASPEYMAGQGRLLTAQTSALRAPGEIAGQAATTDKTRAEIADKQYLEAIGELIANHPPNKEAYAQWVDEKPAGVARRLLKAMPVEQYDPKTSPDMLNKSAMTPEQRFKASQEAKQGTPEQQFVDEYKKAHPQASIAEAQRAFILNKPPTPEHPPQALMIGPNGQAFVARPGTVIPAGSQTPAGVNSVNTPTSTSRSMAEMAKTVVQQVPNLLTQIDNLKDQIGPGAGRWEKLWVNRAGMDNPEFAGLDQDLDLFASALVRTHFGARGGQGYREALKKDFTQAQSPDDLKSRIQHAETWIEGYAHMNEGKAGGNATGPRTAGGPATGPKEGDTATNKATKQTIVFKGGKWVPQ